MKIVLSSIFVNDQESALRFYTEILGFVKKMDAPAGKFRWLTVVSPEGPDDMQLLLEPNAHPAAQMYQQAIFKDGIPATSFHVDNVEREYHRLKTRGVVFRLPPTKSAWSMDAVFEDTCGNLINLHQPDTIASGTEASSAGSMASPVSTGDSPGTTVVAEPGTQTVVVTHIFEAPVDRVYRAVTDPDLIPEWWGPSALITVVDQLDVRPGGTWRFIQRDAEGNEYAFRGVYHTVIPARLVIDTFELEGMPDHVLMETVTYEGFNGLTKVTNTSVFQSVEDRDRMYQAGMAKGAFESGKRMAALLEKLKGN
jgi:uncharacterized protein YndB with AHSA1/START domain/predicted enzyme related to lactoylglutathione lyase